MAEFNSAWGNGECFPGVENRLADLGDRAAARIILNIRAGMRLATSDLEGVIKLGSAAAYLLGIRPYLKKEVDRD